MLCVYGIWGMYVCFALRMHVYWYCMYEMHGMYMMCVFCVECTHAVCIWNLWCVYDVFSMWHALCCVHMQSVMCMMCVSCVVFIQVRCVFCVHEMCGVCSLKHFGLNFPLSLVRCSWCLYFIKTTMIYKVLPSRVSVIQYFGTNPTTSVTLLPPVFPECISCLHSCPQPANIKCPF